MFILDITPFYFRRYSSFKSALDAIFFRDKMQQEGKHHWIPVPKAHRIDVPERNQSEMALHVKWREKGGMSV